MTPGPVTDGSLVLAAPALAAPATEGVTATMAPGGIDLTVIADELRANHVFSQDRTQVDALRQVVAGAQAKGHEISIVVLSQQMPKFTMYRDIATELQSQVGGTVLVFGPNSVGSASPEFSRVDLENATDNLTLSNPPQAAAQMVDDIMTPGLNWTVITIVLIVVVAIGAVLGRLRALRARRVAAVVPVSAAASATAGDGVDEVATTIGRDS